MNRQPQILLSSDESEHADRAAVNTEHIDLSSNPVFQDFYISAMTFEQNSE